jgi:hypothetical protein
MMVSIENISGTNTGASTLNVNGMGELPITGPAGAGLQGGEMAVGYGALLRLNHTGTAFTLLATTGGSLPVKAATASNQAVNLSQLQTLGTVTNGAAGYSASTTLTAANQGQLVFFYAGSAAETFTLPAANAFPAYRCKIVISNQSSYPLTIAAPSGDVTDLNPNVLQTNQYCCVVSDGNTSWHTLWNTAGSQSPFVVGNATSSNEAVNLGQLENGSLSPTFGPTVVSPATASNEAVNLGQLENGSLSPTFGPTVVSPATASNQAVNLGQLETLGIVTNESIAYSASTTLTSANQGQIVFYIGSAAGTFTLPAANALPAYQCKIVISNQSGYPLTIAAPSGDVTGLNPNVLQPNQYCCVANDGNTSWHTLWSTAGSTSPVVVGNATASNEAVNLGQFIESHGTSGYEKLPGGRIRQWTTFTASAAGTNQTITLPIAFTTAIDFVVASSQSVNSFGTASVNGTSLTTVLGSASNAGAVCLVYVEGY